MGTPPTPGASRTLRRAVALLTVLGATQFLGIGGAIAGEHDGATGGTAGITQGAALRRDAPAEEAGAAAVDAAIGAKAAAAPAAAACPDPAAAAAPAASAPAAAPHPKKPRRGGVNPCMTPDPGFGIYDGWDNGPSMGQMIMPHKGGVTKSGSFDVIIHFHGHEPIRKEFVKTAKGVVLVGIDLGIGSGAYQNAFASPHVFTNLLDSVEATVAKHAGIKHAKDPQARPLLVERGLRRDRADPPPAGRQEGRLAHPPRLAARRLRRRGKPHPQGRAAHALHRVRQAAPPPARRSCSMSHSSIIPPGYASTTEVADFVEGALKGKAKKVNRQDVLGLDMFDRFDKGNFHVRGYTGDDKPDHCAHIGLMADIVRRHLEPRWHSPKGKK